VARQDTPQNREKEDIAFQQSYYNNPHYTAQDCIDGRYPLLPPYNGKKWGRQKQGKTSIALQL
jgi:hypothetical protein